MTNEIVVQETKLELVNDGDTLVLESTPTVVEMVIGGAPTYTAVEVNDLTSAVTWADIPDVNVPESAITQHEAALSIVAGNMDAEASTDGQVLTSDGAGSAAWEDAAAASNWLVASNIMQPAVNGDGVLIDVPTASRSALVIQTTDDSSLNSLINLKNSSGTVTGRFTSAGIYQTIDPDRTGGYAEFTADHASNNIGFPRALFLGHAQGTPVNFGMYAASGQATGTTQVPSFFGLSTNADATQATSKQVVVYQTPTYAVVGTLTRESIPGTTLQFSTQTTAGNNPGLIIGSGTSQEIAIGRQAVISGVQLATQSKTAGVIALAARGYSGQTANLTEWQNSSGAMLNSITPSGNMALTGESAMSVAMLREQTSNTTGNTLTVQAGGATTSATDKNGGTLILSPGTSTGSGESGVQLRGSVSGASGTADRTPATQLEILGNKIAAFGGTPVVKQTITGSRGGNAALVSLLTGLANLGWITDSTTA